jgi:aspartyl protease family protein
MTGDDAAQAVWFALAIVLVGSGLLARRWTFRGALGTALAWIAIFGVVLVGFSFRRELGLVGSRVRSEVTGAPEQKVVGRTLRIGISGDGHYWVDGSVNSTPARFLIDSGASITALSETTAKAAGLDLDPQRFVTMQTANGPVRAVPANVPGLAVEPIVANDLPVVVSPAFGDINVIGMNFLSQLKSWRVENNEMILEPR